MLTNIIDLLQNSVSEDGKSYKVTYTIHATSFSAGTVVQYYDGINYRVLPEQSVGTHTFYFIRVGTNDLIGILILMLLLQAH